MSEAMIEEAVAERCEDEEASLEEGFSGACVGYFEELDSDLGRTPESSEETGSWDDLDEEAKEGCGEEADLESADGFPGEPDTEPAPSGTVSGSEKEEAWPYGASEVDPDRPPSRDINTKELGRRGENAAVNFLVRKGYQILERNWTCRFGEADIIALDEDGTVCFVEVKTRRTTDAGLPEEAVTKEKQRRYEKLALTYMMEANWDDDVDLRFDVIGIYVTGDFKAILKYNKGCFNGLC